MVHLKKTSLGKSQSQSPPVLCCSQTDGTGMPDHSAHSCPLTTRFWLMIAPRKASAFGGASCRHLSAVSTSGPPLGKARGVPLVTTSPSRDSFCRAQPAGASPPATALSSTHWGPSVPDWQRAEATSREFFSRLPPPPPPWGLPRCGSAPASRHPPSAPAQRRRAGKRAEPREKETAVKVKTSKGTASWLPQTHLSHLSGSLYQPPSSPHPPH